MCLFAIDLQQNSSNWFLTGCLEGVGSFYLFRIMPGSFSQVPSVPDCALHFTYILVRFCCLVSHPHWNLINTIGLMLSSAGLCDGILSLISGWMCFKRMECANCRAYASLAFDSWWQQESPWKQNATLLPQHQTTIFPEFFPIKKWRSMLYMPTLQMFGVVFAELPAAPPPGVLSTWISAATPWGRGAPSSWSTNASRRPPRKMLRWLIFRQTSPFVVVQKLYKVGKDLKWCSERMWKIIIEEEKPMQLGDLARWLGWGEQ